MSATFRVEVQDHPVDIDDEAVTHAGLALVADDTGRVLLMQRALDDEDPASGKWEFPGGAREEGETTLDTAVREFSEETGIDIVDNGVSVMVIDAWVAPSGTWHGFVGIVAEEESIDIHIDNGDRMLNPDDPDQDYLEAVAFWDPDDLPGMPALRDEMRDTPWDKLRFAMTDPIESYDAAVSQFVVRGSTGLPMADESRPWNGPAAARRIIEWADGSASKAARGFLWQNEGTDGTKASHYRLPFADVIDGTLTIVPRAVFAVASVLEGGRGGVKIPESAQRSIRRKVTTLYHRLDRTPPWEASAMTVTDSATFTTSNASVEFALPPPAVLGLPEDIDAVELEASDAQWEALLVVEGVPTGDGRQIGVGALTHRDLPLPLMGMFRNPDGGQGHAAAEIIGRIDEITFVDRGPGRREVWGRGIYDTGEPAGARAARLNKKGMMRGVSVDLDDITAALTLEGRELFTKGRIMGATQTPFAAFAEAQIRLVGELRVQAEAAMGCAPCQEARDQAQARAEAMFRGEEPLVASGACGCGGECCAALAESEVDLFDLLEVLDLLALTASASALTPQARVFTPSTELAPSAALVASGAPAKPPLEWFQLPSQEQREVRPVRIHSDGRVDGYAALWGSCHTGFAQCITVPRAGARGYSGFQRGQVLTAEGTVVATGPIVMGPEHVAREAGHSIPQVQDAYAAVGCRVADVVLYEDHVGLWVAGAAKPDITDADIRVFNASDGVSPHWLPPRDGGDLAVLCVVTYSGFQTGNQALVASGAMQVTITDGEMGAIIGHNPGFESMPALRAQVEQLTARLESMEPLLDFVRAQQDELAAADAVAEADAVLAALDDLVGAGETHWATSSTDSD